MTQIINSLAEIAADYDVLFCDVWGCLHNGVAPYPEAVAALIADAEAITEAEPTLLIGQHRPVNYQGSGEAMPTLRADEGDLARSVERVWSLLMASNRTPWVFRFAGQPTAPGK